MSKSPEKTRVEWNTLTLIGCLGILTWFTTSFYGGMFSYLFTYGLIILPFIFMYLISFIETTIDVFLNGKEAGKFKIGAHVTVVIVMVAINIYQSELCKATPVMTAVLKDNIFNYKLTFREDGTVENNINDLLGDSKTLYGEYTLKNNLIIFSKIPNNNNFLPDTLFLDEHQQALFLHKNSKGEFITKKQWLNHFILK